MHLIFSQGVSEDILHLHDHYNSHIETSASSVFDKHERKRWYPLQESNLFASLNPLGRTTP
jgi:hypothetical protein